MLHRTVVSLVGLAALVGVSTPASAVYTPNPAGRWQAGKFSLLGDFQYSNKDLDPGGGDIDMEGFFVRPSYSPIKNLSLYGRVGFQGGDRVDVGFAGGFGAQWTYEIPSHEEWAVGAAFDFVYWSADFERSTRNIEWAEFQFSPAVSYALKQVPGLVPYAGLMFDFVRGRGDLSEDDPVGMVFGATWNPTPQVRLETQFRVISENGLFLSAGYQF